MSNDKKSYENFEFQLKMIRVCDDKLSNCTLEKAQRLAYIKYKELFNEKFISFSEFTRKELHLSKSTVSEYLSVVYHFCKEDEFSNSGYCVKSLFSKYNYSQLKQMLKLTEEEIRQLKINPDMTANEIHKIVLDHKKTLMGINDLLPFTKDDDDNDAVHVVNNNIDFDDYSYFKFFDCDKCNMKDMKKTISVKQGLKYLENQIVKDNDNIYYVVKIPKNRL